MWLSEEATMGEVIDIRDRLGQCVAAETSREDGCGAIFRVRLCGPDLRWIGLVGGILAGALVFEGFYTAFEDPAEFAGTPPQLLMRTGRNGFTEKGPDRVPCLVVTGSEVSQSILQRCDNKTVLLAYDDGASDKENRLFSFPGTEVPLFVAEVSPDPLGIAVACAGGAARLLGVIRWPALEQALSQELILDSAAVNRSLGLALEAYNRLASWTGIVQEVPEESG
jgi:hypothetical protein